MALNTIKATVIESDIGFYDLLPIGVPFPVSNLSGAILPEGDKFIILSKDLTGVGQFNENKLSDQTTVTDGNVRRYTAIVDDAESPLDGEVIDLINSTEVSNTAGTWVNLPAVLGAIHDTATRFYANQFQGHGFDAGVAFQNSVQSGFTRVGISLNQATAKNSIITIITNSIDGTPRVGVKTNDDTFTFRYYMRIK